MNKQLIIEKTILSACFSNYEFLEHVCMTLDAFDFCHTPHRNIYLCMKDMAIKNIPIKKSSVISELRKSLDVEAASILLECYDEYLDQYYLEEQINQLKVFSIKRRMIEKFNQGIKFFSQDNQSYEDLIKWVDSISSMITEESGKKFRTVADILENFKENPARSFIEFLEERQEKIRNGIVCDLGYPTHYFDVDKLFDGFKEGHLTIIGARPGVGKTTFMINLLLKQVFVTNISVGVFSLEMPANEIVEKIVLAQSDVVISDFKSGKITPTDFQKIYSSYRELQRKNIIIDDTGRINLSIMESKIKYWKRVYGVKIIFVDYLQLIQGTGKFQNKYEEVTHISQRLKIIAKELDVALVVLAQLNREAAKNDKPKVHDLRDSGSIEQDADEIFLLHNPSEIDPYNKPNILETYLAKNRFGPTGKVELFFKKNIGRIENLEKHIQIN